MSRALDKRVTGRPHECGQTAPRKLRADSAADPPMKIVTVIAGLAGLGDHRGARRLFRGGQRRPLVARDRLGRLRGDLPDPSRRHFGGGDWPGGFSCRANPLWIFLWGRLIRDAGAEVLPVSQMGGCVLGARVVALAGVSGRSPRRARWSTSPSSSSPRSPIWRSASFCSSICGPIRRSRSRSRSA